MGMSGRYHESLGQIVTWQPSLCDTQLVLWENNAIKICTPWLYFSEVMSCYYLFIYFLAPEIEPGHKFANNEVLFL